MKEKETHGHVTITNPDGTEHDVSIVNFLALVKTDDRKVTIGKTEDSTYVIRFENDEGSGRPPLVNIHLTRESLLYFLVAAVQFLSRDGEDVNYILNQFAVANDLIVEGSFEEFKNTQNR